MSDATPPLLGRRILVTGGATGIGAAAVAVLTAAGAKVAATYHQTPPPDGLAAEWLQCDVRGAEAVSAMVGEAAQRIGLVQTDPHLLLFPVIAIGLTMLGFTFLGDGLRDALDPKGND